MAHHGPSLLVNIFGLGPTEVAIRRSQKRRRLAVRVHEARVEVLAPARISEHHIVSLLAEKSRWISKKVRDQALIPPYQPKKYGSGEPCLYLGESYELRVRPGPKKQVRLEGSCIELSLKGAQGSGDGAGKVKRQLETWYRAEAGDVLGDRVRKFARLMGVQVKSLTVRYYKSQWGNCSHKGEIRLNWRLVMAPMEIIDYVVVHELAHLRHHNHGAAFWALVARHMPDYKSRRAWLKTYGGSLRMD